MPEGDASPIKAPAAARFGTGFLRDIWYFAALSGDLKPGRLQRYEILGEPILLGRTRAGGVYALRDVRLPAPRRFLGRIAWSGTARGAGASTARWSECPYHGWRFRTDGVCAAIPSLVDEQEVDVARIRVRRYPAAECQGLVFIWMASDGRGDGRSPTSRRRPFQSIVGGAPKPGRPDGVRRPYRPRGGRARRWTRRTALSVPSGPTGGGRSTADRQHEKTKTFEPREAGFAMVRHPPSSNSYAYRLLGGEPLTEIVFRLPGLRWEHIQVGARQVLSLTCLTPVTETRTRITQVMWSDHPVFTLLKPIIASGARKFLRQDGDMVNPAEPGSGL